MDKYTENMSIEEASNQQAEQQEILSIIDQLEARHQMINIADDLDQDTLEKIATRVVEDYNTDLDSRAEWDRTMKDIMSYAKLTAEKKTFHGEPVSNVKYPIITNAAIQFAARSYPEVIKGTDVVKAKVVGEDPDGQKAERGKRLCEHMSHQLLNEMTDWEEGVDQMLFTLPVVGCAFKKTYYDINEQQAVSEMVFPDVLVVSYYTKSLEKANRITHIIELTKNEIVERIRSGMFLDFDIDELGFPDTDDKSSYDADSPHTFYEQHRWYDIDDDGYQEPYIVTVHKTTEKIVRIVARFELAGIKTNDKGEIIRIEPVHYFTRFLFMPAIDGSFYGMAFGSLLHAINASANSALNQLLDAGASSNRPSGFLGRGIQLGRRQSLTLRRGEWKTVQATGDDLRKNIVPAPTKEPSPTLFQLLGTLVEAGKELSGMAEILAGKSPGPNVPASTTLALIEQGLQVYTGILKRIHRSLYKEYQKVRRLNALFLPDEQYETVLDDPQASRQIDYNDADFDIVPVSDPSSVTNMQRTMKATALLELKGQGLNDDEINKRYLEALQTEDIEAIIPEEQAPDPLQELELALKQAELEKVQAEIEKVRADAALIAEKINSEVNDQQVKQAGVQFDELKLKQLKAQSLITLEENEARREIDLLKIKEDGKKVESSNKQKESKGSSKVEGERAKTKVQGPYRESGLKSNNQKK